MAGVKYSSYTPPLADYFWRRRRNSEALNWLSRLPLNEIACRKVDLLLLVLTPPLFPLSHPPNTRSHRGDIKRWPGSDGKRKIDEPSKLRRRGVGNVGEFRRWRNGGEEEGREEVGGVAGHFFSSSFFLTSKIRNNEEDWIVNDNWEQKIREIIWWKFFRARDRKKEDELHRV